MFPSFASEEINNTWLLLHFIVYKLGPGAREYQIIPCHWHFAFEMAGSADVNGALQNSFSSQEAFHFTLVNGTKVVMENKVQFSSHSSHDFVIFWDSFKIT